jgi:hypothetical protein
LQLVLIRMTKRAPHCLRDIAFAGADAYRRESFHFHDGGVANAARSIDLERFRAGTDRLFPVGLIEAL